MNAVLGNVHDAGIELVAQQHADRLRCERAAAPVGQAPGSLLLEELLLGEVAPSRICVRNRLVTAQDIAEQVYK